MNDSNESRAIQLLQAIADGDEAALTDFYRLFESTVYRFALSRLNNSFEAADILNEVMLQVWKSAGKFENRSKVSTWLLGIARHKVLDCLRKRGSDMTEELHDNLPDENTDINIERAIDNASNARLVEECMKNLSAEHREVIHLVFYEDMHYSEIAKIMDCPEGTVKSRVFHAKSALKRSLSQHMAVL